jgi:hypothetical protein
MELFDVRASPPPAVILVRRGKLLEDRCFVRSPFTHVVLEPLCLVDDERIHVQSEI